VLQSLTEGVEGAERLNVGVAARLSRYLQVLTQARKMGKDRISSQEIADYTNINATQIRRDLSNFGKFGKRGVGYSIDSLLGEIRKILRTQGKPIGHGQVSDYRGLKDAVRELNIVVGVLAVPAMEAQRVADDLVDAGVRIIFNYSEALLDVPGDVTVHTSNPAVELLHALYFHLA
jgi:redox-sensing transcriptional repressor